MKYTIHTQQIAEPTEANWQAHLRIEPGDDLPLFKKANGVGSATTGGHTTELGAFTEALELLGRMRSPKGLPTRPFPQIPGDEGVDWEDGPTSPEQGASKP